MQQDQQFFSLESVSEEVMQQTATFFTPILSPETSMGSEVRSPPQKKILKPEPVQSSNKGSPQENMKRPGVKYKLPQPHTVPVLENDPQSQRVPLLNQMKRSSHSFQNLKKNGTSMGQSSSQGYMKNPLPQENNEPLIKIVYSNYCQTETNNSPQKNKPKIDVQQRNRKETQPIVRQSQEGMMTNFIYNHEKFLQQVQNNQKQQLLQFQNQKQLYENKVKGLQEKLNSKLVKQSLDVSVMNINGPDSISSSLRQSQIMQAIQSPPQMIKQQSKQSQPGLIPQSQPVSLKQQHTMEIIREPEIIQKVTTQNTNIRRTKQLNNVLSQQIIMDESIIKRDMFKTPIGQFALIEPPPILDPKQFKLPKIGSGADIAFKATLDNGMRKSKTAQETQREQWLQQQQQNKPESQSISILPAINSPHGGTLTGFSQSKQGKSFLMRRPQAKIVSRIFSSKSDKN